MRMYISLLVLTLFLVACTPSAPPVDDTHVVQDDVVQDDIQDVENDLEDIEDIGDDFDVDELADLEAELGDI